MRLFYDCAVSSQRRAWEIMYSGCLHVCWRRSNGRINVCLCLESSKECRKPVFGDLSALQRWRHASLKYWCFVRQDVKPHRSSMRALVSKEVLVELPTHFLVGLKRSPSSPQQPRRRALPKTKTVLHSRMQQTSNRDPPCGDSVTQGLGSRNFGCSVLLTLDSRLGSFGADAARPFGGPLAYSRSSKYKMVNQCPLLSND
jgi:hypothetical protein